MPLLMLAGRPGSGKTTRANEIAAVLKEKHNKNVVVINEEAFGLVKGEAYVSSQQEKITRAFLKSNVEKNLDQDTVVIFDSLNYIKGYRFELHCRAKAMKTQYALLYCNSSKEQCREWNEKNENQFPENLFAELHGSFEPPNQGNRWDKPYFEIRDNEKTPVDEIIDVLINQNILTTANPVGMVKDPKQGDQQNFLFLLDKKIGDIINEIIEKQGEAVSMGLPISITGVKEKLKLQNPLNLIQFKKLKQEYMNFYKQNPPKTLQAVGESFIVFLQGRI